MFLKEHLLCEYDWDTATGSQLLTGAPTRRLFDRDNGHQMLYLINLYGSESGQEGIQEGQRIEELIRYHLPLEAKSEISVFNWLRENYTRSANQEKEKNKLADE